MHSPLYTHYTSHPVVITDISGDLGGIEKDYATIKFEQFTILHGGGADE